MDNKSAVNIIGEIRKILIGLDVHSKKFGSYDVNGPYMPPEKELIACTYPEFATPEFIDKFESLSSIEKNQILSSLQGIEEMMKEIISSEVTA